jgi:tripartite ATP-independent transporter DctP family solute receptor
MRLSRKRLLAAGAGAGAWATIGVLRYPGDAAEFSYKLANDQPQSHPMTSFSMDAAERVRAASDGQLEIRVFPSSVLGSDPQMLAQARSGALELLQLGNNVLATAVPVAALESVPFAFHSSAELMRTANGPLGAYIGEATEKIGLHRFSGSWYGGAFQIQNSLHPIDAPADLKGLKIRVPPGPIDVATFKAFDASPTVLTLADVYVSLQTHLVDGIEVPLATVENFKFYELVKFVSLTNHSFLNYLMFANVNAWERLPKRLQEIVEREFNGASVAATKALTATETTIEATLGARGLVFNRPSTEPFRQVIQSAGLYAQWRDAYDHDGWKILEKAVGKLT